MRDQDTHRQHLFRGQNPVPERGHDFFDDWLNDFWLLGVRSDVLDRPGSHRDGEGGREWGTRGGRGGAVCSRVDKSGSSNAKRPHLLLSCHFLYY